MAETRLRGIVGNDKSKWAANVGDGKAEYWSPVSRPASENIRKVLQNRKKK